MAALSELVLLNEDGVYKSTEAYNRLGNVSKALNAHLITYTEKYANRAKFTKLIATLDEIKEGIEPIFKHCLDLQKRLEATKAASNTSETDTKKILNAIEILKVQVTSGLEKQTETLTASMLESEKNSCKQYSTIGKRTEENIRVEQISNMEKRH